MSKVGEKFKLNEKCVHCQKYFNIYSYFSSQISANEKPDSTFSWPLLLACGHNACEKCVQVDGKKGKCDRCHDLKVSDEHKWDNPCDVFLIDEYKEKIRKSLKDSEAKRCDLRSFDQIKKIIGDTKLEIQSSSLAISFKCTKRCSREVLASFKSAIAKINEFSEVRARNNDVDTMFEKLRLSKLIFEFETKMKDNLNADLSAMKVLVSSDIIAMKFKNFAVMELQQKLYTIVDMIENGIEVVVGHRIGGELRWAPVKAHSKHVFVGSFSKNYKPGNDAARIQYRWLQQGISETNLPNFLYLEVSCNDDSEKALKLPNSMPKKFKLVIKVREFDRDGYTTNNYSALLSSIFSLMCTGEEGTSLTGKKLFPSFKAVSITTTNIVPSDYREKLTLDQSFPLRPGLIYVTNFVPDVPSYFIVVNDKAYDKGPEGLVIAEVQSGLCYLRWMCDRVKCDQIKATSLKISDCGLVFKVGNKAKP